jgi:hypothetical protein
MLLTLVLAAAGLHALDSAIGLALAMDGGFALANAHGKWHEARHGE